MTLPIDPRALDQKSIIGYLPMVGATYETVDAFITESGGTVYCNIQAEGGGDLTLIYSDGQAPFASTPAVQKALNAGTDTVPIENWVYILKSTGLLTASTVGFPATEYIPIGRFIVQTAVSVAADGVYKNHLYTDHLIKAGENGHISHINSWIRARPASWLSGVNQTLTITPGAPDTVIFNTLVGVAQQLHDHVFPAFPGTPDYYVINDSVTPYNVVSDLNALLTDSLGGSLSGRFFSLVIWGIINEETGECKLIVNLPRGSYGTQSGLDIDSSNYANYNIPAEYTGVGFLISELKLRHRTSGGGTWTSIEEIDLRGKFASTSAGGTGSAGGVIKSAWYGNVETDFDFGSYRTMRVGDNDEHRMVFQVPPDFSSLSKLVILIEPTSAVVNEDIDLISEYGAFGESAAANSESDTTTLWSFTADVINEFDISGVFSSLAAEDLAGIYIDHNGIGVEVHYFGIYMEYN